MSFERGDHLEVTRRGGLYTHHGLYVGNDRVVEFGGDTATKGRAVIREVSLADFAAGGAVRTVSYGRRRRLAPWFPTATLACEERVERARFLVGTAAPGRYNLLGHNCEHAATWCVTGFPESAQVRAGLWVNMLAGAAFTLRSRCGYPTQSAIGDGSR